MYESHLESHMIVLHTLSYMAGSLYICICQFKAIFSLRGHLVSLGQTVYLEDARPFGMHLQKDCQAT